MASTGNKQAYIAYRVSTVDGAPLDVNGVKTSISGRKQAIALLVGRTNPNAALYEVQFYFTADETITGNPTVLYTPLDCSAGYIAITPDVLIFDPANVAQSFNIISSDPWTLVSIDAGITGIFTLSATNGGAGASTIDVTLASPSTVGQGYITFKNTVSNVTAKIYMVNVLTKPWILQTGIWNGLGFWTAGGIWNTI